ncbi:4'-phosphopantetheinyl transferase family protein [Rhodohalobacter sp. 8-1]|uniref:4'-phosphopantetheinyl transferase family protein n=1 Tax=Rhodohalobacter sp. 8-1 TaxID=3131972 RepID=UPI0030EF7516
MITSYQNIKHSSIPEGLFAGISPLPDPDIDHSTMDHSIESLSGRELLRQMISDRYKKGDPSFTTLKYEKPSANLNGDIISISFSHTSHSVGGVVSKNWVVGIDMEYTDRQVSERLSQRMKHPDEAFKLYENNPIIKIWTMKEAALKAIGTGLRKPMNSVCLKSVTENNYSVQFFNDINAEICSFQLMDQWISICYILPELTESYLSEAYVPIQTRRD